MDAQTSYSQAGHILQAQTEKSHEQLPSGKKNNS